MNWRKIIPISLIVITFTAFAVGEASFNLSTTLSKNIGYHLQKQTLPELDSLANFRDLAAYQTKDGRHIAPRKLLRSSNPSKLSQHDIDILMNIYEVRHVIDFRSPIEIDESPSTPIPFSTYQNFDLYGDGQPGSNFVEYQRSLLGTVDIFSEMKHSYEQITMSPYSQKGMHDFFQVLLTNEDGSVLFHCSSGKDRTGVPTMLLLYILGVDWDTILEDYMLSNTELQAKTDKKIAELRAAGTSPELINDIVGTLLVRKDYYNYALDLINENFQNIDNYIENILGISQADQAKLRELYLI